MLNAECKPHLKRNNQEVPDCSFAVVCPGLDVLCHYLSGHGGYGLVTQPCVPNKTVLNEQLNEVTHRLKTSLLQNAYDFQCEV